MQVLLKLALNKITSFIYESYFLARKILGRVKRFL